jgi:hypothetical protein
MQLFIDFLERRGGYRAARATSWLDPAMPVAVLAAPAFLEASGASGTGGVRLYHVERGCFVEAARIGDAGLRDLDTLVVVDEGERADPRGVEARWLRAGGLSRRHALGAPRPDAGEGRLSAPN